MSYGRIRRGPMAADAFTQIRNDLFRDQRLSFKDKGVFGLISTHRDGYGVTPESIAHFSTDGVSAVKVALRNLEEYGYLRRTRTRNADGTLGSSVYFITDQPETFEDAPELESPSSAPEVENPPVAYPPMDEPPVAQPLVAEPPVENHPHKKTNSKHTSVKKTLSPPARPTAAPGDERETFAPLDNDDTAKVVEAWVIARGRGRNPAAEGKVRDSAALLLAAYWSIPDLIALAEDMARRQPTYSDLARHEPHWVRPVRPSAVPRPRAVVDDTSGRDQECANCDRPIKPGPPGRLCLDCQQGD
ncbi:hypothetical protein [Streptacidiphilus sp. EB129]|uniref:hypothetical protein n=1 Tax=Streptacidiphilus sp. EB129 TaxID=3156262 RepID=UPI0035190511